MALTSQITPYNDQWPSMFLAEKRLIADVFGSDLIEIHHVGSTAVVGLWAKPEIDLLVEVREQTNQVERDQSMVSLGYVRGSNLSHGHHFYRKDVDGVRTHKVHVCLTGHWQIERNRLPRPVDRQCEGTPTISAIEASFRGLQSRWHCGVSRKESSLYR